MRVSKSGIIFACFLVRNKLQLNLNSGTIIIMIYMEIRWFVFFFPFAPKQKKKDLFYSRDRVHICFLLRL